MFSLYNLYGIHAAVVACISVMTKPLTSHFLLQYHFMPPLFLVCADTRL